MSLQHGPSHTQPLLHGANSPANSAKANASSPLRTASLPSNRSGGCGRDDGDQQNDSLAASKPAG
eukprot:scaffold63262_cov15-Prasinocladus_malaysianus.AAC.1